MHDCLACVSYQPSARTESIRRLAFALRLASLLALAVVLGGVPGCGAGAPPPPNVLLVSIDSLRADHVHAYGHERETTPTIDRLAGEGARFETVIAASSWTLPTHMTLLTGLSPEAHGVTSSTRALSPEALTLAEVLHANGYHTAGFVSGPYLRRIYGFAQGFDVYDESVVANGHLASQHGATSPRLTHLVLDHLNAWAATDPRPPFFVFVHMWDVHYDYAPPPPYDTMFDPDYTGTVTATDYIRNRDIRKDMAPRDLEHVIALYDGEIRYTDGYLGRIVDRLAALGVLENTVVVVTADHGDEFFEHGHKGHGPQLYDELLRVPLVVRFPPRVAPGQVIHRQVRQMDVASTILGLVGIAPPSGFAGTHPAAVDLAPWITGGAASPRIAPLRAYASTASYDGAGRGALTAVRTLTAKYIEMPAQPVRSQYFDLRRDPGEHANLLSPFVRATRVPRPAIEALRADVQRWNASQQGGGKLSHEIELDPDQRVRLLQLGYIE
jgi:arylsulfatase A-like enzyme